MPPSAIQFRVLRTIASNRTPDSHVAGGLALNLDLPRLSHDIDIFHRTRDGVAEAAEIDAAALRAAGYAVEWRHRAPGFYSADVTSGAEGTSLDWAHDSAFRFFPIEPHPLLGFVLHPFDLAIGKAHAAASRSEPRDALDLVHIHENHFPLGAVAWAAPATDPGFSPSLLLNWISRFSRHRDADYARVDSLEPISAADVGRRLRVALAEAVEYVARMPPERVAVAFMKDGRVVQAEPERIGEYEVREASPSGGVWPTPTQIYPQDL